MYSSGFTEAILRAIIQINVKRLHYVDLKLFSEIINLLRQQYSECESLSHDVGQLIGLNFESSENNKTQMVKTYNKLSKFSPDGGNELTVESFIRITT